MYFLLLLFVPFFGVHATDRTDPRNFVYRQLDNRHGLSNSSINAILQDKDQLLWIGTWDGLNRFDGAKFTTYNHNISSPETSVGSNVIQSLNEDDVGNIWISTIGGISRYEKKTGKFYRYFYKSTSSKVSEKEYEIVVVPGQGVFCFAANGQLTKYQPNEDQFVQVATFKNGDIPLKASYGSGRLWVLDKNEKLRVIDLKQGGKTTQLIIDANGINNFFLLGSQLVYTTNADEQVLLTKDRQKIPIPLGKRKIKVLTAYHNYYLVAWENQGLSVFDQQFRPSGYLQNETRKLENVRITSISRGQNNMLWFGTDGNGLVQVYQKESYFGLVAKMDNLPINKPIRSFAEAGNDLWVGTKGNGILIYRDFWQQPQKSEIEKLDSRSGLDNNAVYVIKHGADDLTYIGSDGKGITLYDHRNSRIVNWKTIRGAEQLPDFKSVYAIWQAPDGRLWLGTSGYGLIELQISRSPNGFEVGEFKQYATKNYPHLASDIIYALAPDNDGRLWLACRYGGLSVFDFRKKTFKTYKASGLQNGLSHSDVLSLYFGQDQTLWIGTSYGLNYLTHAESLKNDPAFTKITTDNGLPNNTIHGIAADGKGNVWLSTNRGLAKLNTGTKTIANYQETDGLQSNEFSDGAVYKAGNGQLLFGGIYGFNYFLPKNVAENTIQPNLLISDLQFGGQSLLNNQFFTVKPSNTDVRGLEIERKNNFFQFALTALNYFNASKNEFAYKLNGLEKDWHYTGTDGKIAYYNIPAGKYTLMVRWSNGEGVWTKDVEALHITIRQFWWLTWPAYMVYLLIVAGSAYAFHRYRKNKVEMKFKLERETLFRQKDEEIHQQRINFFTNIAHEIQTPLTLIMGSVEHTIQKEDKNQGKNYFLSLIHQHTARLTYLVQQLLEFRRAEAGYLTRNDDYVDISKMLNSLKKLFEPVAVEGQQYFNSYIQENIAGFIDKDKYEKILFNLLSNAFKHAGRHAEITFQVNYDADSHYLETIIANSGCTLTANDLDLIFSKYHVAHDRHFERFSTGIGLAFTKELVALLAGELTAELKADWIYFKVRFKLNTNVVGKKDEVVTSAPSYLYESILRPYDKKVAEPVAEINKNALLNDLQGPKQHKILIVEDDVSLRFLLKNVLDDTYVVYEAENGQVAMELLEKAQPDLIISDVMMPDMDGLELCRLVKTTPATMHIPLIMLSAKSTEENKTEGYELGADAYIPKPFHIDYLLLRVRKLLEYQKRMNELLKDKHINNQFSEVDMEQGDREFLNALVKAVEDNLAEPDLDAAKLEDILCISKMQLYRKLKSLAGMTPSEFIKRIRLKYAAVLLRSSKLTVSEIFYQTGFNNRSYFFREFKKIYGQAPNDYRAAQHTASGTPENIA